MTISDWLDELENRFIDNDFWRRVAEGHLIRKVKKEIVEIKQSITLQLEDNPELSKEDKKEAEKLFLSSLMGRSWPLSAATLVNVGEPRKVGLLNQRETVCLWLGLFREQTFGLAGLWQMYLDIRDPTIQMYVDKEDLVIPLPQVIQTVFDPHGENEENQDYIAKILAEANLVGYELTDEDTSKIVAWIVETKLPPRLGQQQLAPLELVNDLKQRRGRAVNAVNQDFKRGGNTLMDKFVRRVYSEIDK